MAKLLKSKRKIIRHKGRRYELHRDYKGCTHLEADIPLDDPEFSDMRKNLRSITDVCTPGNYLIYKQIESKEGKK